MPKTALRLSAFAIVGVNDGIVYSANPCLRSGNGAGELAWAEQYEPVAILYANTADPGPALSSHWPTGQTTPRFCDPASTDSAACAYDYGWNAAADSYQDAVNAYVAIGAFTTSKLVFIKELGLGTALAVLIDASVIRGLLVPSLMQLLGNWNWWAPRSLRRLHARTSGAAHAQVHRLSGPQTEPSALP